ncbi:MAG: lipid deacylase LpxR family protein [Flavipsychrobacter sp.]|jgi:hypothetical protein|nr:lipid deacylase LpxR family protein [Flavipsychrobacter sp.]
MGYRLYTSILILLAATANGQAINNTLSYKNINSDKYFRFNYENDFFSGTDMYYTQGIHAELVTPSLKHFPLSKILVHPKYSYTKYGVAIEHNGYTPSSISSDAILYGDRPFVACLFLKTFRISVDTIKKQRFSSSISTGLMGQGAGGKEMQEGIHKWTSSITPHGWSNQICNDAILNYQVDYEKQLLYWNKIFAMDVHGMARIGTLSTKAALSTTLMLGYFENPFGTQAAKGPEFRIYAYEHPEVSVIGYDATLQGGSFNNTSPYTISSGNTTRAVFQNRFGFVVMYRKLYLEYFQSMHSSDFKTGNYHVWGGIQIAACF